jgi:hypothetical protein
MPAERIGMRDAREIIRLKFSSGVDARDRPAAWLGALDGAGDIDAGGDRGPVLTLAGGPERRGAGGCALRQSAQQTRPSADRGTGLGRRASRTARLIDAHVRAFEAIGGVPCPGQALAPRASISTSSKMTSLHLP